MKVLITGGASGLGEAITRHLARNPSNKLWFSYHSSSASAKQIESQFANARAIKCDFRDERDLDRLLQEIEDMDLDGLVNNALPVRICRNHFHKIEINAFRDGFNHSVTPTICITQKVISLFRKKKTGRIVTILTATLVGKPPAGY